VLPLKVTRSLGCFLTLTLAAAQLGAQAAPAASAPAAVPSAGTPAALSDTLTGEAKESYEAGKLLYGDGDYAGAELKFQRAYELSHEPRLLWNMLVAEKNLRRYAHVEELIHRYLETGGAALTDADRADAQALLEAIGPFIASVTLTANQPDARVLVDDVEAGRTPLAKPLRLDMGSRKLRVVKAGFKEFTLTQTFTGGAATSVEAALVPDVHEGRLRVSAGPGDAIRVDSRLLGFGEWEGKLPSGAHAVEVSADGKETWRADSMVSDDQLTTVLVALQDKPKAGVAGVPTWVWIAGGSLLAAGLGTGAYFLFRPEDKGPPAPTPGSLGTVELPFGR
jgi:PEGA domain-containing protein